MLSPGQFIRVETKTKDDVFGTCVYEVKETGLKCPCKCGADDGIKFVMLGGSGPAARAGYPVHDCAKVVQQNIKDGITVVIPAGQAKALGEEYGKASSSVPRNPVMGIEID